MTTTHVTTEEAVACRDGFLSSGPSPTPYRLHVLGAGQVARALIRRLDPGWRLVCLTDRSGSVHDASGLDGRSLAEFKEAGGSLAGHARGQALPLSTVVDLVEVDVVVDARSTEPDQAAESATLAAQTLKQGRQLVFAAKAALSHSPGLVHEHRSSLGFDAVLGGTGACLQQEREGLAAAWTSVACVPNATTSAILDAIGSGLDLEPACERARTLGLLESDPRQDLDGTDAALKLALVASVLEGTRVDWREVERPRLDATTVEHARSAAKGGRLVRLVGRVRRGERPRLRYESVEPGSLLAPGPNRVVYEYEQRDGSRRVHIGSGLGPERTAAAVRSDLRRLATRRRV